MMRKFLFFIAMLLPACDYCVENAHRVLGADVACRHGAANTALCHSPARGKGYVCFTSEAQYGEAVCIEGLPSQAEVPK